MNWSIDLVVGVVSSLIASLLIWVGSGGFKMAGSGGDRGDPGSGEPATSRPPGSGIWDAPAPYFRWVTLIVPALAWGAVCAATTLTLDAAFGPFWSDYRSDFIISLALPQLLLCALYVVSVRRWISLVVTLAAAILILPMVGPIAGIGVELSYRKHLIADSFAENELVGLAMVATLSATAHYLSLAFVHYMARVIAGRG